MFAKVFGQIFDSSIAEDYNCRRMFMDLLVLADSDGVVDMTQEAISRRTNVPMEEVVKYISALQEPDTGSRSKQHDGRRLVMIDPERGWGWQIVNYRSYRQIRDEEARRSYFREAKQKQRKGEKKKVKDTLVDTGGKCETIPSPSASSLSGKGIVKGRATQSEIETFCETLGLPKSDGETVFHKWEGNGWINGGKSIKDWKATIRAWKGQGYMPSQKNTQSSNGSGPARPRALSFDERAKRKGAIQSELNDGSKAAPKDRDGRSVYDPAEQKRRAELYREMEEL